MSTRSILFLNFHQAASGRLLDQELPRDYVLACRFLHCGVVDRTKSLEQGFDYSVLDPIPEPLADGHSFARICDATGAEIVSEAVQARRKIAVLWSGGIDSTAALIAVMKAAEKQGRRDLVQVLLSLQSVEENPRFYLRYINKKYLQKPIRPPISDYLDPNHINVTGEHGDQLFGSQLLKPYVRRGSADQNYEDVLTAVLIERLGNAKDAERVMRYLGSVTSKAPIPIRTLFDYMWWLNFSLKWQTVTLRLAALRKAQAREVYRSLAHFFRGKRFQTWSFYSHLGGSTSVWERYKEQAKQYILAYTGDEGYYRHKEKESSLMWVMRRHEEMGDPVRVFMRDDFRPVFSLAQDRQV